MSRTNYDKMLKEITSKLVNIESMLDFLTRHFTLNQRSHHHSPKIKRAYNKSNAKENYFQQTSAKNNKSLKASALIETPDEKLVENTRADQNGQMMIIDDASPAIPKPNASNLVDKKAKYTTLNGSNRTRLSNNRSITKISATASPKNRPMTSKMAAELEEKLTRAPQSQGVDLREMLVNAGMKESFKKRASQSSTSSVFTTASTRSERYLAKKMIMKELMDNMEKNNDAYELHYDGRAFVLPIKKNQAKLNQPKPIIPEVPKNVEMINSMAKNQSDKKSLSYDMFGGF